MNDQQEAQLIHFAERQTHALERLTVAVDRGMAARAELEEELKRYKRWYEETRDRAATNWERAEALFRSNAALRGAITKLKKRLAEAQA